MSAAYMLSIANGFNAMAVQRAFEEPVLVNRTLNFDVVARIFWHIPSQERVRLMYKLCQTAPFFVIAFAQYPSLSLWMDVFSYDHGDHLPRQINLYTYGLWLTSAVGIGHRRIPVTVSSWNAPRDIIFTSQLLPEEAWPSVTRLELSIPSDDLWEAGLGALISDTSSASEITVEIYNHEFSMRGYSETLVSVAFPQCRFPDALQSLTLRNFCFASSHLSGIIFSNLVLFFLDSLYIHEDDRDASSLYDILLHMPRLECLKVYTVPDTTFSKYFWQFPRRDSSASHLVPLLQHLSFKGDTELAIAFDYLFKPSYRPLSFAGFTFNCFPFFRPDLRLVPAFRKELEDHCHILVADPSYTLRLSGIRTLPSGREVHMDGDWALVNGTSMYNWSDEGKSAAILSYKTSVEAIIRKRLPPILGLFDTEKHFSDLLISVASWYWLCVFIFDGTEKFFRRIVQEVYYDCDRFPVLSALHFRYSNFWSSDPSVTDDELPSLLLSILRSIPISSRPFTSGRELLIHVNAHPSFKHYVYKQRQYTIIFPFNSPTLSRIV